MQPCRSVTCVCTERTPKTDLVVLDVMLPEFDGYQVLERIRTADAHLPALMLTARDQATDHAVSERAGPSETRDAKPPG